MPKVRDVLARRSRPVITVSPERTVLDAARLMNEEAIGGLPVVEEGALAGIFTERDVLRRIVAAGVDPAATAVREVMTTGVIVCGPDTPLEECRSVMTTRRVRHLPVVEGNALVGMITSGDLLAFEVAAKQETIDHLQSYVFDARQV